MGASRKGKIYELGLVQAFYDGMLAHSSRRIFVDIGANTGSFSLLPAVNKELYCYSFEPNPVAFDILGENIELNNIVDNVFAYNFGVWSERADMDLKIPIDQGDSGLSTFGDDPSRFVYGGKDGAYKTHKVRCVTLDSIYSGFVRIGAIKIDTEGSEIKVLKGAKNILRDQKPLLLFEYDNKNTVQFGYDREDIVDYLKGMGYTRFELFKKSDMFAS